MWQLLQEGDPSAESAAHRLLLLCRIESDPEGLGLVAECLALLFPAALSATALTPQGGAAAANSGGAATAAAWRREHEVSVVAWREDRDLGEALISEGFRRALLLLHRSLTDTDETTMLLAARALHESLTTAPRTYAPMKNALEALRKASPLLHKEIEAYRYALQTRMHALAENTAAGAAAFHAIRGATQQADKSRTGSERLTRGPLANRTSSKWLWSTVGKTHNEWVCALACEMLNACKDYAPANAPKDNGPLRALRVLSSRQPSLARELLCPALLECLQGDGLNDSLPRPLAAAITSVFDEALSTARPPTAHQLAAVGVLVGVLITLRACTMHARHAHRKSSTTGAEHAWTHSFWGEIDFVKAAAAAHAAGSPISALMLLEFAAEAEGELVPATILGRPPLCRQYAVVSADLPAPDCARNVPSGGSLSAGGALSGGGDGAGTLRVLALRGDHVSALGLLDAAQQQAHLDALAAAHAANAAAHAHAHAPSSQSQWPAAESDRRTARRASSMPSLVLRSARALHTLGCHALCAATLRAAAVDGLIGGDGKGAASGTLDESSMQADASVRTGSGAGGAGGPAGWVVRDGAVEGELRELRAECAWRLSAWDGAWDASAAGGNDGEAEWSLGALAPRSAGEGVVGGGGVVGVGFHERLRSAMYMMHLGQAAAAHVQLQACLLETARRLGAAGEEGGKQSLTHILAIRMAADAKEVALRSRPAAALRPPLRRCASH
jgi:hypothetical protein